MSAASANVEMWLELANALLVLASLIFVIGGALGAIVTVWLSRRAAARRQRGWLRALREGDEERRALMEDGTSQLEKLGLRVVAVKGLPEECGFMATDEQIVKAAEQAVGRRKE